MGLPVVGPYVHTSLELLCRSAITTANPYSDQTLKGKSSFNELSRPEMMVFLKRSKFATMRNERLDGKLD